MYDIQKCFWTNVLKCVWRQVIWYNINMIQNTSNYGKILYFSSSFSFLTLSGCWEVCACVGSCGGRGEGGTMKYNKSAAPTLPPNQNKNTKTNKANNKKTHTQNPKQTNKQKTNKNVSTGWTINHLWHSKTYLDQEKMECIYSSWVIYSVFPFF